MLQQTACELQDARLSQDLSKKHRRREMPPIEFPPEQVLLLQGIQTYATVKDLKDCLKLIGCKPEIPPKLVKDRKNKNFKACFLNFGSREEAKVAYQNISRKIGSFPLIFDASKGICSQKSGGGTIVDEDDVPLVDHIVTLIKKSPDGFVQAAQIGASVRKNESWDDEVEAKGGLKYFCSDNDDKLQFVVDGGCGKIKLAQVKRATLPVGTKVSIKVDRPSKGWGSAFAWSVGTVRSIDRGIVLVDFPEAHNWKGDESDLEQVSGVNRVTKDIGSRDSAFDEFGFVRNLSDGKFEFTGNAMEDRDAQHREFGFVHSGQKLTRQQPYFEVSIVFNCPQSIGIGLSGNNFHAGSMVGSVSESIGLHSNDGKLFYEGNPILFGPTSSAGDTIGCGIFFDESDKPETIFFTRNKTLVGRFPLGSVDRGMLFPVVSSASPAVVKVDLKVSPPTIPIACVLRTFALEAKFNDESNKFKPVKRQGPPNHKGEIPVVFKGYKETVWIPNTNQRIKKIEDCPVSIEFSNFELAFEMINDGDMIEVIDESIHMMRECIHIRNNLTVVAAAGGKPTISGYDVHVFNIHASTVIKGLFVRSVGGDKLRKVSEGGGAGVVLFRGDLSIEDCVISSENGTAIGVSESKGVAVARNLTVKNSKCGPCGRHGVVVYPCTNEILLQSVDISAKMYGVANNDATLRIIDCGLKHASSGLICVRTDQKTPSPHTTIFRSVINCKLQALIVKSSAGEYELTSKECTIENCERAIEATGKGVIVFFDNSNSVKLSSKPNLAENCAKIEVISSPSLLAGPAHVTEAPHIAVVASPAKSTSGTSAVNIAAISSDASPLKQDVKNDASVSSEATNFHRFCRLLQDVGTEILVKIFKVFYEKKEKKPWKASCGSNLLSRMASGKFYTQQYKIISQGNCEEWDITLLSSLLIHAPGYLNTAGFGKAVKGVETIRKARNDISHKNVLTEETRVLSADVFKSKWTEVSSAAEELLHYLSETDKAHYHSKIQEISKEACHADMLQKILERFDVEDRMIQEGLRRANEKAEEAMKMAQEMKEKLPAQMKVEVNAIVQEIFKRGQVDPNSLPRDIYLDNDKIYTLVKKVGKGGFGTVFKALAKHADDKAVALKICEVQHERADREKIILEKLSGLNHDNIVRFLDASLHHAHHQAHLVIIMELIKGESLEEWLVQRYDEGGQGVTWQASTSIVQQLANGMAAIHSVNVTHRDLKPSNLMFDEHTDILVIVDFGLSKEFNANMTVTADKDAIGTALYMSPEQHDGIVKEISFPADIWAIGIIWHEILTGYVPFESDATSSSGYESTSSARSKRRTKMGTEAKASMYKFLSDTEDRQLPLLIGEIPSNIGKIIARCLYTKQERRYRNAEELFKHVQDVFESLHADGLEQAASLAGENEGEEEISPKMRMGLTESGVRRIVQEISGGGGIRPCIVGFFAKKSSDKEEMKTKVLGWETDPSIGKVEMAEQLKAFLESNTEINVHGEAEELMMGYTHGRSVFDVHVHPQPTFDMFSDCMIHAKERNMRIVHFSGHGNAKCGFFWLKGGSRDYEQVRPMDFVNLFKTEAADSKVGGTIECVILNACETESMGRMLRENGVPHVVCWRKEVQDETAMSFSKIFYKILDSQKTWQNINYSRIFQQVVARCRFEPLRLAAGVDVICLLSKDGDVFTEPTNLGATDRDDATNSEPPSPMNFRGDSSGSGFAASEKIKNKQSREFWEDYFHDTEQVEWSTFARALEQEYNIEERVLPLVQSKMDVNGDGKIGVLEFNIFTKKLGLEVALDELIKRSSVAESKDFACFIAAGGDRCPSVPPPSPPTVTEINEPLSPEPTAPDLPVDRLANFKSGQNDEFDSNEELFRALKASMEEPVQESERDRLTDIGLPFAKLSETRINYVGQGAVLGGVKLRVGFLRLIGAQLACLKDDRNSYKAISPLNECQLTKTTASMSDGQDTGIQVTSKNEKPQVYIFGSLQQRDEWFESLLEVQKLITGGMKLKSNFWQISGKVEVFGFNSQLQLAGIGRNPRGDRARLIVDSPLSNTNPYCELLLRAFEGKEVAGIGLTKKVNRTGMPGWHPGEVGWHGDDLCMFLGNGSGTSCGLEGLDWKAGDRIGCGIMFNGYNAICVFFTRNGALVETVPMKDKEMRYITIGLDSSSFRADLNLSAPLPPSLLSAVSQRNERVKVMGSEGDILTSSSRLDYVQEYISKSPNEKCQISLEPGEYILNNTLRVEKDGIAFSANKGTAVIRKAGDGPVIQCIGKDISLLGITVRVNGGNKSLKSSEGGAIGVQICKDASCILDNCAISTDCGTAVNVQDKGRVVMTNCEIGPCARTGVIVDSGGNASVEIIETSFQQCQNFAMVFNEGRGKVKECNIIGHVGSGRSCGIFVRGPGESTLDVEKTEIRDVGYAIMVSEGGKINLEECTLLDTDIGIDSEGKGSLVNVMKTLFRNSKTCDLKKAGEGGVTHYKCTFVDGAGAEKASPTLFRELAVGDRVRVKKSVLTPAYNWCGISHDSIGTIKSFHGGDVRVDFPQTSGWLGKRIEMELV